MRLRAIALAVAVAACPSAPAATSRGDASSGTLAFTATQADAKFTGAFRQFRVALDLDPSDPAHASLDVTVDTASIDTRDGERDEILRSPDFFWSGKHPQAVYHATRFERAGAGWRASGELRIRGVTRPVPVTFTLDPSGTATVMKGEARLKRLDFGLGQGDWAATEWVGNDVDIRFELRLAPAG